MTCLHLLSALIRIFAYVRVVVNVQFIVDVERPVSGGCMEERRLAIEELAIRQDMYVPRCRTDGGYTDEQCHNATGYCWCVTADGKPIPGSSIHGRQRNCAAYFSGKISQRTK